MEIEGANSPAWSSKEDTLDIVIILTNAQIISVS